MHGKSAMHREKEKEREREKEREGERERAYRRDVGLRFGFAHAFTSAVDMAATSRSGALRASRCYWATKGRVRRGH